MKRTMVFHTEELPEDFVVLLTANVVEIKELRKYLMAHLNREIAEKGVRKVVEDIYRANYGENWKEKVDAKLLTLERLLSSGSGSQNAVSNSQNAGFTTKQADKGNFEAQKEGSDLLGKLKALK